MGFGFALIGFPLVVMASFALFFYSLETGKKTGLIILGVLWGSLILIFILGRIADYYRTPIHLTRQDIIGEYRIDTSFYPGKNAKWQYDHYKFIITNKDSMLFIVMKEKELPKRIYHHKLSFSDGPPALWSVIADSTHHVIRNRPILYRSHKRFYYVFYSPWFGNMFFRKMGD